MVLYSFRQAYNRRFHARFAHTSGYWLEVYGSDLFGHEHIHIYGGQESGIIYLQSLASNFPLFLTLLRTPFGPLNAGHM